MSQAVTKAYLLGVTEGRETLRFLTAQGMERGEAIRHSIETCNGVYTLGFAGEMAEFNRGQRDFFANQPKLARKPQDFDTSPLPLFGDSHKQRELF